MAALDATHPPLPIAFDKLRIPLARGRSAAFKDARIEDITAATRALTKTPAPPTSSAERASAPRANARPSGPAPRTMR
jgi:hypothetical protein